MIACILISLVIGAITEGAARLLKLWRYTQPQTALLNIVAVFGLVMGTIAGFVPQLGPWRAFALAATVGFAYEVINLRFLQWWHFPGERLLFVRGHHAIVLVLTILWGTVPLLAATIQKTVVHPSAPASVEGRLAQLNTQEARLLEALEGIRQKERGLEARLEHVRRKKQMLLDRRTPRNPRSPTTPQETQ